MLRAYTTESGLLKKLLFSEDDGDGALRLATWIDLQEPTIEERQRVESLYPESLPKADEVEEIEASARYFIDRQDIHIHSLFLYQSEGRHRTATVAFTLKPDRLLTFRDADLADFRLMRRRIARGWVEATLPLKVMTSLFEQKVENLADTLEDIHRKLEEVSFQVLEDDNTELESPLDQIAKLEDSNGKVRLCLMDTQRSLSFLQRHIRHDPDEIESCREMLRDLDTLMSHATFLFEKINFLMEAAQGFINIKQNQIIKIFSIAAVVFLPPTLVASIYGMNFHFMPELEWWYGYPLALGLMLLSAITPYWYFKRKGWL